MSSSNNQNTGEQAKQTGGGWLSGISNAATGVVGTAGGIAGGAINTAGGAVGAGARFAGDTLTSVGNLAEKSASSVSGQVNETSGADKQGKSQN